jgi:hypothetical protein
MALTLSIAPAVFAQAPAAAPQGQANRSVQPQVEKRAAQATEEKQRALMAEAQSAIAETEKALQSLDGKRTRQALDALAVATGKLELILARNPKLALAPARTEVVTHELLANADTVKDAVKTARRMLGDGEVQGARHLLAGLASEIEFRTLNIPLQTYPAAIKAITPLIDAGRLDEARVALQTLLNTLVVTSEVVPLPKLRAEEHIKAAQALAEKKSRSAEENARLSQNLAAAREQLQIGELLGYGEQKDLRPMYAQLDDIEKKSAGGKSGVGWFDKIRQQMAAWSSRRS